MPAGTRSAGGPAGAQHERRQPARPDLLLEAAAVQHVQQRLLVHQLVLDRPSRRRAPSRRHQVRGRAIGHRGARVEQRGAYPVAVGEHLVHRGPRGRHLRVVVTVSGIVHVGIDSAREELVEGRVERGPAEQPPQTWFQAKAGSARDRR